MAAITPTPLVSGGGTAVTFVSAAGGGDTVTIGVGLKCRLIVRNGGGSSINVTLTGVRNCSAGFTHNTVVACAVGDTDIVVPGDCINPATGVITIAYSAVTSVTIAALTFL